MLIIARTLAKALNLARRGTANIPGGIDDAGRQLMLGPDDYRQEALFDAQTRRLMARITFAHGGPEYDARYPDGIPTSVLITTTAGDTLDSGLMMYPAGHARNKTANLASLLKAKWLTLASPAVDEPQWITDHLNALPGLDAAALASLYDFAIKDCGSFQ